jgi:hypothetical protein
MDKIAICAIFKDEARYLLEWLAFHRLIGVDSFVLYDNGSTDGGPDLIRRSHFARHVTLIDWPGVGMQIPAYQDFCAYHAAKFDWAAIIDLDEFIMPVGGDTIREPLTRRAYSDYSSILLQWFVFGPSGHQRRPDGLVIESYTRRLPDSFRTNLHVKPLVRGKAVSTAGTTPHIINVSGPTCNTRGQTVLSYAEQPIECHDVLAIHHYYTKSRDDWLAKLRRGKADAPDPAADPYADSIYFEVERDAQVDDRNALRFVPRLKAMLPA